MATKTPRRLVIDTSVARAAGTEESVHPTGRRCCEFLTAVKRICHRVVMTPGLIREWDQNQSSFARNWRQQMISRRKYVMLDIEPGDSLRDTIGMLQSTEGEIAKMQKDRVLIEAAIASDSSIVSLDESARRLFVLASSAMAMLNRIVWVNPDRDDEQPIHWLKRGAKPDRRRMLGRQV